jgi:hypothetical protein
MKRRLTFGLFVWLLLGLLQPTFGYGNTGHEAIALLASKGLNDKAKRAITNLLGDTQLANVATWADQVRGNPAVEKRLPKNGDWHFVNLPLGAKKYPAEGFTSENDIVHAIQRCIQVLEAPPAALNDKDMTKAEALKFLVHFVGDLHQPLHVACAYYSLENNRPKGIVKDPAKAKSLLHDRGGNGLLIGNIKLHAYWDSEILRELQLNSVESLLTSVSEKYPTETTLPKTKGDYHKWAEKWAGDSLAMARTVYDGIERLNFEEGIVATTRSGKYIQAPIVLKANYAENNRANLLLQIARAGYRLRALLNTIDWKE